MNSIKDLAGGVLPGRLSASSFRNEKKPVSSKMNAHKVATGSQKSVINKSAHLDLENQSAILNQEMEVELISVRNENEMLRDKVKELEKWLIMLLNNFYEGNPTSLKNIEQGLQKIDELRVERFGLQKAVLLLKKQNIDVQNQFLDYRRQVQQREEEIRRGQGTDVEKLILEKSQLEQTLVALSEEVETLSQRNERMLKDLQKREFYGQYHQIQTELEKLQQAHHALISTVQTTQGPQSQATPFSFHRHSRSVMNTNISPKTSFLCGIDKGPIMTSPRVNINANQTLQTHDRSGSTSFFSLLSCNGCSPNNPMPGMQRRASGRNGVNDYPIMDEFESLIVKGNQDVNFMCQSDRSHYQDHKRQPSGTLDSNYNSKSYAKNSPMDSSLIRNVKMTLAKTGDKSRQL